MSLLDDHLPSISLEDSLYVQSFDEHATNARHSPSPSHSPSPIDIPYPAQEYSHSPTPSNFNFPGTPSYQGSYAGSFGSQHSASHNWGGRADQETLQVYEDEYNPSEYDVHESSTQMYPNDFSPYMDMIHDDFDFPTGPAPSVSVVPAETVGGQQQPDSAISLEHGSPHSSFGDPRSPSPLRSRASSVASSRGSPQHNYDAPSPFEPQWGVVTAPSPSRIGCLTLRHRIAFSARPPHP